jgi:hypothetical protein
MCNGRGVRLCTGRKGQEVERAFGFGLDNTSSNEDVSSLSGHLRVRVRMIKIKI